MRNHKSLELLAQRIKLYRLKANLTAAEVATKLGILEANYRKYENGSRIPKDTVVRQLADIFKCTVEDLYDDGVKSFTDQAHRYAFLIALGGTHFYHERSFDIGDWWAYWGNHYVGKAIQDFFSAEMQASGMAPAKSMKELIDSADQFLHGYRNECSFPKLCQAGIIFIFSMIRYLLLDEQQERRDDDIFAEVQAALDLPNLDQARQAFLFQLYIPFVYFLDTSMMWTKDNNKIISHDGYQYAVNYHFFGRNTLPREIPESKYQET